MLLLPIPGCVIWGKCLTSLCLSSLICMVNKSIGLIGLLKGLIELIYGENLAKWLAHVFHKCVFL